MVVLRNVERRPVLCSTHSKKVFGLVFGHGPLLLHNLRETRFYKLCAKFSHGLGFGLESLLIGDKQKFPVVFNSVHLDLRDRRDTKTRK